MKPRFLFLGVSLVLVAALVGFASGATGVIGGGLVRAVGLFGQALALIRANYVEELPVEKLELGAMTGLVEAADPGGSWVPADSAEAFAAVNRRELPAYGLVLGRRASYPVAVEVLPGSAAEAAGVKPGEMIERIGEEPVRARPVWRAQVLLDEAERRKSDVALDVIDRGFDGKRRVVIHAAGAGTTAPTLERRDGVPVLRMPAVAAGAVPRLEELLRSTGSPATVIVDLRGTGLGAWDGVAPVAAVIAGGAVTIPVGRKNGGADTLTASGPDRAWKLVVCVDPTTAGPAEALALGLKGRGATLVGVETYGDTGQRRALKARGGQLWLADRWCLNADGKAVLGDGVKPDEVVRMRRDGDPILERALEIARGAAVPKAA